MSRGVIFKLSKNQLLKEFHFFQNNLDNILLQVNSNRLAIINIYQQMQEIVINDISKLENLIELDVQLNKINTYIEMAYLNQMEDHEVQFDYITRIPGLLFKLNINKLKIIQLLKIDGSKCKIHKLPKEIGYLRQLKELDLRGCNLTRLPKELRKNVRITGFE